MPRLSPISASVMLILSALSISAAEVKTRTLSARILCIQNQQGIESVRFGPTAESTALPQRLLVGDYSLPFPVQIADDMLNVFSDSAQNSTTPVASARVPADASQVTLLFIPGSETPYRVYVMPDDASHFKANHLRFLNLSPLPVRFRIEDQLVDLPAGKLETLTSQPKRDRYNMANVAMASMIGEEWKVVSQTQWHFVEGNRLLILVYLRPGTQRLVTVSYKDLPGSEKLVATTPPPLTP